MQPAERRRIQPVLDRILCERARYRTLGVHFGYRICSICLETQAGSLTTRRTSGEATVRSIGCHRSIHRMIRAEEARPEPQTSQYITKDRRPHTDCAMGTRAVDGEDGTTDLPTHRSRAVCLAATRRSTIRPVSSQEVPTIRSRRAVQFRRRSSLRSAAARRSASWSHRRTRSSRHGHQRPCLQDRAFVPDHCPAGCHVIRRVGWTVSPALSHRRWSRPRDRGRHDRMRPAPGRTEQGQEWSCA